MRRPTLVAARVMLPLVGGPTEPPAPDFAGRWQLVSADGTSDAADVLLVTLGPSGRVISIERDEATGVQVEDHDIGSRDTALRPDANWMGAVLVLRSPARYGGAGEAASGRQETWAIEGDGRLHIVITEQASSGATSTTRLVYRRVVPEAARSNQNLISNGDAELGGRRWVAVGDATAEACDGDPCFVVRNHGSFQQTVLLPGDAAGKFLAIVGSASSERVNADGAITGLPSLHGMVATPDGTRFLKYLQGQSMLARPTQPESWVTLSGVFPVPEGAARLIFDLNQAEGRGVPQNGSAARFDHVGVYLFSTEEDARAFVAGWSGRR